MSINTVECCGNEGLGALPALDRLSEERPRGLNARPESNYHFLKSSVNPRTGPLETDAQKCGQRSQSFSLVEFIGSPKAFNEIRVVAWELDPFSEVHTVGVKEGLVVEGLSPGVPNIE